jgi:hypothetical protein
MAGGDPIDHDDVSEAVQTCQAVAASRLGDQVTDAALGQDGVDAVRRPGALERHICGPCLEHRQDRHHQLGSPIEEDADQRPRTGVEGPEVAGQAIGEAVELAVAQGAAARIVPAAP